MLRAVGWYSCTCKLLTSGTIAYDHNSRPLICFCVFGKTENQFLNISLFSTKYSTAFSRAHDYYVYYFFFQDSEVEESSNLNAPATPSMSDVDDGEEVVSFRTLLTLACVTVII